MRRWVIVTLAALVTSELTVGCRIGERQPSEHVDGGRLPKSVVRVVLAPRLARVGADGDAPIGLVADAMAISDSEFVVLDGRLNTIRLFKFAGQARGEFGGPGQGPGELGVPRALGSDSAGHIYVYDEAWQRLSRFVRFDRSFRSDTQVTVGLDGASACFLDEGMILLGLHDQAAMHELSFEGRRIRSFGAPFGGNNPALQASETRGVIGCFREQGVAIVAPRNIARLDAFDVKSGALVWSRQVPDYHPILITQPNPHSVKYTIPEGTGYDYAISVVPVGKGLGLIQFGRVTRASRGATDLAMITSLLVRASTGAVVGFDRSLPWVLSTHEGIAFTTSDDPAPHVDVVPYNLLAVP